MQTESIATIQIPALIKTTHIEKYIPGIKYQTANQWANEMLLNPEFNQYVYKPTQAITILDIEGLKKYWKWKEVQKWKG